MTTSTHKAEVVFINKMEDIPGADFIGLVYVWGFPCVIRKEDFNNNARKLFIYLPPDSLVPTSRKEFAFLDQGRAYERIRVRKYKEQKSYGLLVKAPSGAKEGEDYAGKWKIDHYEPRSKDPTPPKGGYKGKWLNKIRKLSNKLGEKPPKIVAPYYDIEALRRYPDLFAPEDMVVISEKLHGSQVVWCWEDRGFLFSWKWWLEQLGRRKKTKLRPESRWLRVRSRKVWRNPVGNYWADACSTAIIDLLQNHPDWIVFGEICGPSIQKLTYGLDKPTAFVFDIRMPDGWMSSDQLKITTATYGIPLVPILYIGEYKGLEFVEQFAEGKTTLNGGPHIREGVVVKSVTEEKHPRFGRKQLKLVGFEYLEKGD